MASISDVERVMVLAMKDTFLEPVGSAVERVLADGRFTINNGADLEEIVTRHAAVWFPNPADTPERDLATAMGHAFGVYYDAKVKLAKDAAEAQAKADAEAPAKALKAAQIKADASKAFAERAQKAAEEANKKAATDAELAAARNLTAAADAAQKQALQDQLDADLLKSSAANAAKVKAAPKTDDDKKPS